MPLYENMRSTGREVKVVTISLYYADCVSNEQVSDKIAVGQKLVN